MPASYYGTLIKAAIYNAAPEIDDYGFKLDTVCYRELLKMDRLHDRFNIRFKAIKWAKFPTVLSQGIIGTEVE